MSKLFPRLINMRSNSILILSTLLLLPSCTLAQSDATVASTTAIAYPATTSVPDYNDPSVVESKVRAYFADIPVMVAIAKCESKFRQFDHSGEPLDGGAGGMIGIFQINGAVHKSYAASLGFDIDTVEGNLGYARHLYEESGTGPWDSSASCWGQMSTRMQAPSQPQILANSHWFSINLHIGMINAQILTLQKVLNAAGFTLAAAGPGAPGNETTKFGALTRESVRRFQCAKISVCSGDENSTGYGYVGPRTRAALVSIAPTS
jgi:hypothetical protein